MPGQQHSFPLYIHFPCSRLLTKKFTLFVCQNNLSPHTTITWWCCFTRMTCTAYSSLREHGLYWNWVIHHWKHHCLRDMSVWGGVQIKIFYLPAKNRLPTVFSQCSWMVFFRSYFSFCVLPSWWQDEKQDLATWRRRNLTVFLSQDRSASKFCWMVFMKSRILQHEEEEILLFCLRTGLPQSFALRPAPGGSIRRATSKR